MIISDAELVFVSLIHLVQSKLKIAVSSAPVAERK